MGAALGLVLFRFPASVYLQMVPLETLRKQLAAADVAARRAAVRELAKLGGAASDAATALAQSAADADEDVRTWAAEALENLGPPDAGQTPELLQLLQADSDAAYWAATLLGRLESAGADVLHALAQALAPPRPLNVRERAAWALGQLPERTPEVVQALQVAARSAEARLARLAQAALDRT